MKAFFLFSIMLHTSSALNCPANYHNRNERCILYMGYVVGWLDAYAYCRENGGNLPSIHSFLDNEVAASYQPGGPSVRAWLGAVIDTNGAWSWADGTPWDYTNFQWPRPTGNYWASLNSSTLIWELTGWQESAIFWCVADPLPITTPAFPPTTTNPLSCLPFTQQTNFYQCASDWQYFAFNNYAYIIVNDVNVTNADDYCRNTVGAIWGLASIHSKEENDFIASLCCEAQCYAQSNYGQLAWYLTGGQMINGVFQWSDGSPVDYAPTPCLTDMTNGTRLAIMNYDISCEFGCGQGDWAIGIYDYDVAPYVVCKGGEGPV